MTHRLESRLRQLEARSGGSPDVISTIIIRSIDPITMQSEIKHVLRFNVSTADYDTLSQAEWEKEHQTHAQ